MTSVQKSNQDRISVGNGNVIACEHIKNLHHLICTCKPTSVLRVFMVWWFFCLSLNAHSDSEGDGKTLSWLRQQVSYTSLYPCSRWRGRIQTVSIIVSACMFRWRKKELSNTQVKDIQASTYQCHNLTLSLRPRHINFLWLVSFGLVWRRRQKLTLCGDLCSVWPCSGLSAGLQWWRARWRYVINYWADGCSIYICKTSYRFLHFKYLFYEYQTLTISIKIYYFNIPAFPVLIHTTVQRNMVNNDLDRKVLVIQSLYILAILIGNWINSIPNLIYDESLSNGSTVSCEFVNKQWSQLMIVSAPPSTPSPYQLIYPDQMQLQVFTPNQASVYPGKINIIFHSIV